MADNMKLFLELVANASGFKTEMNSSKSAVTRFARGAKSELDALKGAFGSVHGQLASLGVGIGAVKIMMDSARLDKSLTQIGQTAGEGSGKVSALRAELFALSRESGQGVEDLRDGFNSLVQSGLNMKESKEALKGINTAMAVTGANAQTLSSGLTVAATAYNFDLAKPGMALDMLDKMTVAGRLGNAELENLSSIFARVGVNSASAGMGFEKTLAFIEGLSMVEKNPERLATLADSTMRVFTNLKYMSEAQKGTGVKFFDAKGARRDALDVLGDIKKKYDTLTTDQQRAVFIQKAFGHADLDTIKGIKTLLQGDALDKVREFSATISDAGGTLKRDFSEATRNLIDQTGMLKNDLREAADGFVQPINKTLGQFIQFARDKKENGGLDLDGKEMIMGGLGGTFGTLLLARYGAKSVGAAVKKMLGHGSSVGLGVAEGKALEMAAGVTPVFVVNWPGGFGAGGAAAVAETAAAAAGGGSTLAAAAPLAIPLATAVVAELSMVIGKAITDAQVSASSQETLRSLRGRHMVMGGGEDSYQVKAIDSVLNRGYEGGRGQMKNDINLSIAIDGNNRVVTQTSDPNTHTKINTMRRGSFAPAAMASSH
ncbi:phage tail tape measure protein [Thiovibrio frasassiensis]|uniref:Phage tail tape measure protein n=1 Tax=Thiovibrio frasassiensis TaxID=2984131 RepID=A0A9X4MDQ0_9BACT|nr:phage tail tape measure protein [Thiovibrio frasassiensis]MDG4475441.1 phage tail tape measure protein [Thiovibrio frasassiensis]